jgi:hypothetical protein
MTTPTPAPAVLPPLPDEIVKQSQRERVYESLLKAAVGQLKAWQQKYGQHGPSWLPPGGDVNLMQTIDDWLNSAPEYPIPAAAQLEGQKHLAACDGGGVAQWQPIETAPRDGTEVLGFRGDAGVFVMRWIAPVDFLTERELADPHGEDRDWEEEPDWFYADFIQGGRLDGTEAPTHWMPLPAAPAGEGA